MFDTPTMAAVAATFLLAGVVKGVIGLGLLTISMGAVTALLDLHTAMALLVVPALVTNLWQAATGGNGQMLLRRLWPFLLPAAGFIWIGALGLTRLDPGLLSGLLGVLLIAYAALSLAGIRLAIPPKREVWAGALFGAANGVLTGMTGSFVVPGVMYLQAIGLPRDMLVQAMGLLFTVSTLALTMALGFNRLLPADLGMLSAAALIPALLGMFAGQRLRRGLSETRFKFAFFVAVLLLGVAITVRAIVSGRP